MIIISFYVTNSKKSDRLVVDCRQLVCSLLMTRLEFSYY